MQTGPNAQPPTRRRRRSVLYVPAANPRAMAKALTLDSDAVIFDLEDAVAPEEKPAAAERLAEFLAKATRGSKEFIVRINPITSDWAEADLSAAVHGGCDAILVPKIEAAGSIEAVAGLLHNTQAPAGTRLWAMIETAAAILNIAEIAALGRNPLSRLDCLVVGTNDLVLETGVEAAPGRPWISAWLMQAVLAARAGEIDIIDGVFNDFQDEQGLQAECAQARAMGFDGKTLIHPNQIDSTNRVFSPTAREIAHARSIVAAFDRPENRGKGVISLDGRMVERLHLVQAERLLARAILTEEKSGAGA